MKDIIQFTTDIQDSFITSLGFRTFIPAKTLHIISCNSAAQLLTIARKQPIDIIMSMYTSPTPDSLHARKLGLSPALFPLLKKKHIALGFAFRDIITCTSADIKALIIGRMMSLVNICRAYHIPMVLCSFATTTWELRGARDLWSFGRMIGMTGKEATDALHFNRPQKSVRLL